ncbi:MAG TPA: hypothetical protein VJT15_18740 [Pyrinomonadaceae bacterium]|nr:hypothetical protein [Pyrinomonadaceae bacterium]
MQTQLSTANPDLASLLKSGYRLETPEPPPDPIDPPDNQGGGGKPKVTVPEETPKEQG